jgi:chemotaxis protein methyltransferase CheR
MVINQSFTAQEYEEFRRYLHDSCGITLGENKQYLITSRLGRLMHEHAIHSLGELIALLRKDPHGDLPNRIIDAMTTNETYWFRDSYPFDILKSHILPDFAGRKLDRVRIWSAACSSGQEPYSISMTVQEYVESNPGKLPDRFEILATDISSPMLNVAKQAIYDDVALSRGLTPQRKQRYFDETDTLWQVKDAIRQRVRFVELNLISSYDKLGKFDVIYCRNVLIYFSNDMKREILSKLANTMRRGGYLIMGVSESPINYSDAFDIIRYEEGLVYRLTARR